MTPRPTIEREVFESLTDWADEHDVSAIVDEIFDRYGRVGGIDEVPAEDYWAIVERHAR